MNADITRVTFDARQHRAAVVMQQGRVQLDADWNEQADIARYRLEQLGAAVIGGTGVPKDDAGGGFAISVAPNGTDLLISPGTLFVDGIMCESTPSAVSATVVTTTSAVVDTLVVDELEIAVGQFVVAAGTTTTLTVSAVNVLTRLVTFAPALSGVSAGDRIELTRLTSLRAQPHSRATFDFGNGPGALDPGRHLVYLDAWLRERTVVDQPSIAEPALNGIDTSTRLQVAWRVGTLRVGPAGQGDCSTPVAGFPPATTTATLTARVAPGAADPNPCVLPDAGGYRGLEHQLYRVEVHRVFGTDVVLKWQRDNASLVSMIDAVGTTFVVDDLGRDDAGGFTEGGYVELTNEALVLANRSGDLLRVGTIDRASGRITIDNQDPRAHAENAPTLAATAFGPRARRWDGVVVASSPNPQWLAIELGLQVRLSTGDVREGDYWLIPARTATVTESGTLDLPRADDGTFLPMPPDGVHHHVCRLALIDVTAAGFATGTGTFVECRPRFPALTAIQAADVTIDPLPCGFTNARNVQEAIDELCGRNGGTCTRTAQPGAGWERVFDGLAAGTSAEICFPVGDFPLANSVVVTGTGHLTVHGAGWGSRVTGDNLDTLIVFRGWASVTVRDIAIVSGFGSPRPVPMPTPGLAGALSFEQVGHTTVEAVNVRTAPRTERAMSCVSVYGAGGGTPGTNVARIARCRFDVGDRQVGVLGVNLGRFVVEDNVLGVVASTRTVLALDDLAKTERTAMQRLLFNGLAQASTGGNQSVVIGGKPHRFTSIPEAAPLWASVTANKQFTTTREFTKAASSALRAVTAGRSADPALTQLQGFLRDRIARRRTSVISQGIVAAGSALGDVFIERNQIDDALQGVHIAASHQTAQTSAADLAAKVTVGDNRISVVVPAEGARARHGIFVGSARSVVVRSNELHFQSLLANDPISTAGIKVFGFVERQIIVRDNHVEGFPLSVHLFPLMPRGGGQLTATRLYRVAENVFVQAGSPVRVEGPLAARVKVENNAP